MHVHANVRKRARACHTEILLKCPYLSLWLQGMDVVGGHFGSIKPKFRKNLQKLLRTKVMTAASRRSNGQIAMLARRLGPGNFVEAVREPWMEAIGDVTKNAEIWGIIGVCPFNLRPYWDLKALEDQRVLSKSAAHLLPRRVSRPH